MEYMPRKDILPSMDGPRFRNSNGEPLSHFSMSSTFIQYTVVPEIRVAKINPKADLGKVCLFGCGVATGMGAALQVAKVKKDSVCAVFGLGCIGLAAVIGCKLAGAAKIIGVDIVSSKKDKALAVGCTDFVNPTDHGDKFIEYMMSISGGFGCDFTFDAAGSIKAIETAIDSTKIGTGLFCAIGVPPGEQRFSVDPWSLLFGKRMTGTVMGGYTPDDLPSLVDLYLEGKVPLDELVSCNLPLESINDGLAKLEKTEVIRTVLTMDK